MTLMDEAITTAHGPSHGNNDKNGHSSGVSRPVARKGLLGLRSVATESWDDDFSFQMSSVTDLHLTSGPPHPPRLGSSVDQISRLASSKNTTISSESLASSAWGSEEPEEDATITFRAPGLAPRIATTAHASLKAEPHDSINPCVLDSRSTTPSLHSATDQGDTSKAGELTEPESWILSNEDPGDDVTARVDLHDDVKLYAQESVDVSKSRVCLERKLTKRKRRDRSPGHDNTVENLPNHTSHSSHSTENREKGKGRGRRSGPRPQEIVVNRLSAQSVRGPTSPKSQDLSGRSYVIFGRRTRRSITSDENIDVDHATPVRHDTPRSSHESQASRSSNISATSSGSRRFAFEFFGFGRRQRSISGQRSPSDTAVDDGPSTRSSISEDTIEENAPPGVRPSFDDGFDQPPSRSTSTSILLPQGYARWAGSQVSFAEGSSGWTGSHQSDDQDIAADFSTVRQRSPTVSVGARLSCKKANLERQSVPHRRTVSGDIKLGTDTGSQGAGPRHRSATIGASNQVRALVVSTKDDPIDMAREEDSLRSPTRASSSSDLLRSPSRLIRRASAKLRRRSRHHSQHVNGAEERAKGADPRSRWQTSVVNTSHSHGQLRQDFRMPRAAHSGTMDDQVASTLKTSSLASLPRTEQEGNHIKGHRPSLSLSSLLTSRAFTPAPPRLPTHHNDVPSIILSSSGDHDHPAVINRRNSLSDLRIPARITNAQVRIEEDIERVKRFAEGIEDLKSLGNQRWELIHLPTYSGPACNDTLHKSSAAVLETHRLARRRIDIDYRSWWEQADALINLGDGQPEEEHGQSRGGSSSRRERCMSLVPTTSRSSDAEDQGPVKLQQSTNNARPDFLRRPSASSFDSDDGLQERQKEMFKDVLLGPHKGMSMPTRGVPSPRPSLSILGDPTTPRAKSQPLPPKSISLPPILDTTASSCPAPVPSVATTALRRVGQAGIAGVKDFLLRLRVKAFEDGPLRRQAQRSATGSVSLGPSPALSIEHEGRRSVSDPMRNCVSPGPASMRRIHTTPALSTLASSDSDEDWDREMELQQAGSDEDGLLVCPANANISGTLRRARTQSTNSSGKNGVVARLTDRMVLTTEALPALLLKVAEVKSRCQECVTRLKECSEEVEAHRVEA